MRLLNAANRLGLQWPLQQDLDTDLYYLLLLFFIVFFGGGDRVWGLGMLRAYIGFRDV